MNSPKVEIAVICGPHFPWLQTIPGINAKKNYYRDFSNGVEFAKIVDHFQPNIVEMYNYVKAYSSPLKRENWTVLNNRVLSKLGLKMSANQVDAIVDVKPKAIDKLLSDLRAKFQPTEVETPFKDPPSGTKEIQKLAVDFKKSGPANEDTKLSTDKEVKPKVSEEFLVNLDSFAWENDLAASRSYDLKKGNLAEINDADTRVEKADVLKQPDGGDVSSILLEPSFDAPTFTPDSIHTNGQTEIEKWLSSIPFSRKIKNIPKDFSDGILFAELIQHLQPKAISRAYGVENWINLSNNVLDKLGIFLTSEEMQGLSGGNIVPVFELLMKLKEVFKTTKINWKNEFGVDENNNDPELTLPRELDQGGVNLQGINKKYFCAKMKELDAKKLEADTKLDELHKQCTGMAKLFYVAMENDAAARKSS